MQGELCSCASLPADVVGVRDEDAAELLWRATRFGMVRQSICRRGGSHMSLALGQLQREGGHAEHGEELLAQGGPLHAREEEQRRGRRAGG